MGEEHYMMSCTMKNVLCESNILNPGIPNILVKGKYIVGNHINTT
jgi:hypothetical protein